MLPHFLVPAALLMLPAFAGLVDSFVSCGDAPEETVSVPLEEPLAILDGLYATYEGLPGFVDVYYRPDLAVPYRPLFVGEVPAAAHALATPVPVEFDTVPAMPEPMGPGLVPDAEDTECLGQIRPGARLVGSGSCTANFIFTDGNSYYVGTAGHCIEEGAWASVSFVGLIGPAVFSTGDGGVGNDFALIRIEPEFESYINPEMCDWGGPTGVFTGSSINGRRVLHTGHGYGVAPAPPRPKAGYGQSYGSMSLSWLGAPMPGDSGSAIRLDGGTSTATIGKVGLGVGILTHGLGFGFGGVGVTGGIGYGQRLDKAIQMSGIPNLQLVTVPHTHLA